VFLPLGDSPNPVGFKAWVNWALLAANVAIYVLVTLPLSTQGVDPSHPLVDVYLRSVELPPGVSPALVVQNLTAYDLFVFEHGFKPGAPELPDLFASMFLHGGFMHLAGNMLFLWIYGDNVEHRLGRVPYLLVYLGTGIVATLTFAIFARGSLTPLVGASGAISGVLGLYFLMFPRNVVKVFVALFPFIINTFWIRARWVLGFYVVVDNLLPFVAGASSNVAYGAHLGGFFAGLGVAWLVEARGGQKPRFGQSVRPGVAPGAPRGDANLEATRAALRDQDLDLAVLRAAQLGPQQLAALSPRDLYVVARGLAERGRDDLAGRALRRGLALQGRDPQAAGTLHLALGELRLAQGQPSAAYQHLLNVLDLAPGTSDAERAEAALRALASSGAVRNHW
jgi:membrane associated rhomboid family serine protease